VNDIQNDTAAAADNNKNGKAGGDHHTTSVEGVKSTGSSHHNSLVRDVSNSGFVRLSSALNGDERYKIQMRLQVLYRRMDGINNKMYAQSNISQDVWSDVEEENDLYQSNSFRFRELEHHGHSRRGGRGVMESVLEEGGGDDNVTEFRVPSERSL
jgi:hypothetical protein